MPPINKWLIILCLFLFATLSSSTFIRSLISTTVCSPLSAFGFVFCKFGFLILWTVLNVFKNFMWFAIRSISSFIVRMIGRIIVRISSTFITGAVAGITELTSQSN